MNRTAGVVIGLDVGSERIGVARGDVAMKMAFPLHSISNDDSVIDNLKAVLSDEGVAKVVVGLPRNSKGEETEQSKITRQFAETLSQALNVDIVFQDESLTSVIAEQRLRDRKDFRENMLRDGTLDSEAAVIILNDYLERN